MEELMLLKVITVKTIGILIEDLSFKYLFIMVAMILLMLCLTVTNITIITIKGIEYRIFMTLANLS